ncbi:uncharacterized protein LOC105159346 [Sesamum indicum]|uniref:Uncharacterized protein LOC105159346 n=1 Tax=Sesamum indicum TaxID=4182 RepID=A0A6I9SYI3_SESIN|nr:uncharacterized protein LOC105159346 [Sesamum indicum]
MKQSTTTSSSKESSLLASATEDEIIVSQILLDLRNLISLSESLSNFNWGCRRRRSCLDAAPSLPPTPSLLPPPVQRTDNGIEAHIKAEEVSLEEKPDATAATRTTASPDTPLSFSPSESDEKSKHSSKKTSKKRSKQEYIDMIEGLTQRKDLLRGEIENVKKYYNKLKAYNSELKAIKKEVLNTSCPRKEEEKQMETGGGMNPGVELTQHYRVDMVPHQQPYIQDPMGQNFHQYPLFGPIATQFYSSNSGFGSVNHVGPLGIDLNIPAEEALGVDPSQPLDAGRVIADKRARFAEARRKRRGIIKIKNMRSACGIKLPASR